MSPVLDSVLVESLLLGYARQGEIEPSDGPLVIDETKAHPAIAKLLAKNKDLEAKLAQSRREREVAEETIKRLESDSEGEDAFRSFDWEEIEQTLLNAHRLFGSAWVRGIAERVLEQSAQPGGSGESAAVLQREIAEHIRSLIGWVSR